jgi:cation diffusion facilitator CzcD-associated flavoprotein CzcO
MWYNHYRRLAANNPGQDKRVAVIGNGSSGIQIVPSMLPKSAHLDHYIRGRTWLSPTFAREKIDEMGGGLDNCKIYRKIGRTDFQLTESLVTFTTEHLEKFRNDPNYYQKFRKGRKPSISHPIRC